MKLLISVLWMIIGRSHAMMQASDGWLGARGGWSTIGKQSGSIRSQRRLKKSHGSGGMSSKNSANDVAAFAINNSSQVVAVNDGQNNNETSGRTKGKKTKGGKKKGKKEDLVVDFATTFAPVEAPVYEPTVVPSQPSVAPVTPPELDEKPTGTEETPTETDETPTPSTPTNETEAIPTMAPQAEPILADDIYQIFSCGNVSSSSLVSVDVSYIYMISVVKTYDIQYAIDSVYSMEERTLKAVAESLLSCDNAVTSRRRLTTYAGVSAAPKDIPNGLCGEFCTIVKGGMTVYTVDVGASDMTQVECSVLAIIRDSMLQIESRDDGIDMISFIGDSQFDCSSGVATVSGLSKPEDENRSQQKNTSAVMEISLGVAAGISLLVAIAALAVMKRRNSRPRSVTTYAKETDSVMTPDTGADTHGISGSPDRSFHESPQQVSGNSNAVKPTGLAATILGFCDYQTDQHIVGRDANGDFVYDTGDDYGHSNHVVDDVTDSLVNLKPLVSPIAQESQDRELRSRRKKRGIVVSPGPDMRTNRTLFLDAISEDDCDEDDDAHSVETPQVSNTSTESSSPVRGCI